MHLFSGGIIAIFFLFQAMGIVLSFKATIFYAMRMH